MTTTTVNLGWSGGTDGREERAINDRIVMRTNRVLGKLHRGGCSLIGSGSLSVICDAIDAGYVDRIASEFRYAESCGRSVRETEAELLESVCNDE